MIRAMTEEEVTMRAEEAIVRETKKNKNKNKKGIGKSLIPCKENKN